MAKKKASKPREKRAREPLPRSSPNAQIHEVINAAIDRIEELEDRLEALESDEPPAEQDPPLPDADKVAIQPVTEPEK